MDLMLHDLSAALPNLPNQVVFASTFGNPAPKRVMAFDGDKRQFVREARMLSMNKNYLFDKALARDWIEEHQEDFCCRIIISDLLGLGFLIDGDPVAEDPFDNSVDPLIYSAFSGPCEFDAVDGWVYLEGITLTWYEIDTSHFHPKTFDLADVDKEVAQGTQTMGEIVDILESVLGPIACTGVPDDPFDYEIPELPDQDYIDGYCMFLTIARYHNAILGEGLDGTGPLDNPGVHLRSRWVIGEFSGARHLSVHFEQNQPTPLINNDWISAFPSEDPSEDDGGDLISCDNPGTEAPCNEKYSTDSIANTAITALVEPPPSIDAASLWQAIKTADSNYEDDLVYCALPEEGTGGKARAPILNLDGGECTGFNSNSFAIGIVNAVNGSINQNAQMFDDTDNNFFDMNDVNLFPGINTPVPASAYNP